MIARRLVASLFLALALLVGQQAAALHGLTHATEQLGDKQPGSPTKHACEQCFLSAQLAGAVGTYVSPPPPILAVGIDALQPQDAVELPSTRVPFQSRAPPTFL